MLFIKDYDARVFDVTGFFEWYLSNVYLKENKLNKNGEKFSSKTKVVYQIDNNSVVVQIIDLTNGYMEDITEDISVFIDARKDGNALLTTKNIAKRRK